MGKAIEQRRKISCKILHFRLSSDCRAIIIEKKKKMSETKRRISKKKIIKITALSLAAVLTAGIIAAAVILYGRIASILSVRNISDELYTMNFQQDYHLDKALSSEIKSKNDLMKFICDDMFFGYQMKSGPIRYACSTFSTETPEGEHLVGRNLDFNSIETLSLYRLSRCQHRGNRQISGRAVFEHRGKNRPSRVAVSMCRRHKRKRTERFHSRRRYGRAASGYG